MKPTAEEMQLWVFEEETLAKMADDARFVASRNVGKAGKAALNVLEILVNEMRSRQYDVSRWTI